MLLHPKKNSVESTASYSGEELEATFTAEMVLNDLGVPRSPTWLEVDPTTIKITSLTILGKEIDLSIFQEHFPDVLEAIECLSEEIEFEVPDHD